MGTLFDILIFSAIGRIYLHIRYSKNEKREQILKSEFYNSYSMAGRTILLQAFAFAFMILIFGSLLLIIFSELRRYFF